MLYRLRTPPSPQLDDDSLAASRALAEQLAHWGRRLATGSLNGAYASRFHGGGLDFADLQEYSDGDPARSIDWHATLRSPDRTYRRRYEEDRDRTLLLACDLSASVWEIPPVRRLLLHTVALLAASAAANRDAVALLGFSDREELFIPARRDPSQTRRLLTALTACRPIGRLTALPALLERLRRLAPPRARLLLLSDFPATSAVAAPLAGLASRHDLLLLRLLDDLPATLPPGALLTLHAPESNIHCVCPSGAAWTPPPLPPLPATLPPLSLLTSQPALPQLLALLQNHPPIPPPTS